MWSFTNNYKQTPIWSKKTTMVRLGTLFWWEAFWEKSLWKQKIIIISKRIYLKDWSKCDLPQTITSETLVWSKKSTVGRPRILSDIHVMYFGNFNFIGRIIIKVSFVMCWKFCFSWNSVDVGKLFEKNHLERKKIIISKRIYLKEWSKCELSQTITNETLIWSKRSTMVHPWIL